MSGAGRKEMKLKSPGGQSPRLEEEGADVMRLLVDTLKPIMDQLAGINQQLTVLNQTLAAQQFQVAEMAKQTERTIAVVKEMHFKQKTLKKRVDQVTNKQNHQEHRLLSLQMEKANMILRFQGVPESPKEDLKRLLSDFLASVVGCKAEEHDIEAVYRVYSNYTKKNSLPGEISVRFSRRQTRDAILRATLATPLKTGNDIIKVLKDIPFEIRQKQKNYKDLTLFLQTNQIRYKWAVPEGVVFKMNDKREKIDSMFKAKEFLKRHLGSKEDGETGSSGSAPSETDKDLAAEEGAGAQKPTYAFRDRKPK